MKALLLGRERLRLAVLIVIAAAAAAGVVKGREKPALDLVEARPARAERAEPAGAAEPDLDLARLARAPAGAGGADPFAAPAPPAAPARRTAAAAAPEAPAAPPLPFEYFGRLTQAGKTEVFVMRGDELISIVPGQRIGAEYRVDAITERSIRFTYLPTRTAHSIELQGDG
ncbi:MAG TPA: hypothetical protein VM489_18385 [Burkholderiales bacterium]|nr:hypothetical protein [Burkholderiales bacterium]